MDKISLRIREHMNRNSISNVIIFIRTSTNFGLQVRKIWNIPYDHFIILGKGISLFDRLFGNELQFSSLTQALTLSNCSSLILSPFNSESHMRTCIIDVIGKKGLWIDIDNLVSLRLDNLLSPVGPSLRLELDTPQREDKRSEELLNSLHRLVGSMYCEGITRSPVEDRTREVLSESLISGTIGSEAIKALNYERSVSLIEVTNGSREPIIKDKIVSLVKTLSILLSNPFNKDTAISAVSMSETINDISRLCGIDINPMERLTKDHVIRLSVIEGNMSRSVRGDQVSSIASMNQDSIDVCMRTTDPESNPELVELMIDRYLQLRSEQKGMKVMHCKS